jgi:beta-glucanase (GH16 family)
MTAPADSMPRPRRLLGAVLVTVGLIGAALHFAGSPERLELAAGQEPPVDECGTRPARSPASSTTTTTTTPTTSTTVDPSSTTTVEPTSSTTVAPTSTISTDEAYWRCALVEDFDGTALDRSRWVVQTTTGGNFGVGGECFVDSPNNIAVSDGSLKLTVRKEAASVPCPRANNPGFTTPFTAGSIISRPALDQAYGRYEIRARMPLSLVPGLQFAFWLWPRDLTNYPITFGNGDSDKWTNGELDALEWYSRYPFHQVPFIHYAHTYVQTPAGQWVPNDPNITKACLVGLMADWHTYALEWTSTSIRMLYDGKVCLEDTHWTPRNTTMPGPFDKPFMVSLTQALGALGTDNQLTVLTPLPATAEVDYLKIWQ